MKAIKFITEKTKTGYSAFAKDYPVCTTGKDYTKLKMNMLEALNLFFDKRKITGRDLNISI